MALSRSIDNYGGLFADAVPVEDPTTEQSAAYGNRLHEDLAHLTRTSEKVWCTFATTTTAAPVAVTVTDGESHAGTGAAQLPTCSKTATGKYLLTYASAFTDALGVSELRTFKKAKAYVQDTSSQFAACNCTISGNSITVDISTTLGAATLSDLGGSIKIVVEAR